MSAGARMMIVAAPVAIAALAGCAGPGGSPSTSDSADLIGSYTGILPCADCAGIRTDLLLYTDRYDLRETYIGTRDGDRTTERTGRVRVTRGVGNDREATVYQLQGERPEARRSFLRAGDNELRLLDGENRELATSLPHSLYRATMLAESDAGKAVDVRLGERVVVRLNSNRTTGYRWSLLTSGAAALTHLSAAEYTEEVGGKPGAGGVESWYFQAGRSGQEELRFEYRRPWEVNVPAAKSANYTIRVR